MDPESEEEDSRTRVCAWLGCSGPRWARMTEAGRRRELGDAAGLMAERC